MEQQINHESSTPETQRVEMCHMSGRYKRCEMSMIQITTPLCINQLWPLLWPVSPKSAARLVEARLPFCRAALEVLPLALPSQLDHLHSWQINEVPFIPNHEGTNALWIPHIAPILSSQLQRT